ncbi:metallophosphoesterase family protein [Ruminococcus flavefaciens]|uniref:metallophosphoesterase family protein n=1 Tax=Ruminococcus flavefaciens TaxID=1265 RepID=UPI0026F30DE7|nr:metallophosphoesterase [Ruminococcus flavefaciens]MDD7515282.1 metallophosphoesterase [Ruminococcus flavefaciens]MDY5692540.1 metallophosphoesterase [Ruminococcus flavefaciens]
MIYVTGDTHGDITRFKSPEMKKVSRGDTLIIAGDFGFLWDNSKQEKAALKKLTEKGFTIAFLDGCHENFDMLEKYPTEEWKGGKIHRIAPNIVHLLRGQVYTIEKRKIFTFGGGHSQDIEFRRDNDWWEREQPTHEEIMEGIANLRANSYDVDYIITHEPPASLKECLVVDVFERLEVHAFFEDIIKTCKYKKWFFGKCHIDKHIPIKFFAVFNSVIPLK